MSEAQDSVDRTSQACRASIIKFISQVRRALDNSRHTDVLFKVAQIQALESVHLQRDTLVLLPTGYGKSLIFQLLPWLLAEEDKEFGIVLVVSPLNSLIVDQLTKLLKCGIQVGVLPNKQHNQKQGEELSEVEGSFCVSDITDQITKINVSLDSSTDVEKLFKLTEASVFVGGCALVYTHPENVVNPSKSVLSLLLGERYQNDVVACVVDEAHCIVEWGSR